eukprot:TRINITY_DN293_c0_g1_i3.p1 TRINITY_DN293_c0_g1~~TRINITY_DN293_c0_g1_i3.p1  ORF type:complete len:191 (+),score=30.33 TRINITY_DN293_c0_g1_i3:729-1301(+)
MADLASQSPVRRLIRAFFGTTLLGDKSDAKLIEFLGGNLKHLKLLYKASRDGFGSRDFHRLCDNKGPTVAVIKRNGSEKIFGGYTPLDWHSSNAFVKDDQFRSFIYTIDNEGAGAKYQHNKYPTNAIYCGSNFGPIFGGGHDLYICDNSNTKTGSYTNTPHSYSVPANTTLCGQHKNYTINEIEVFSVQI